MSPFSRNPLMSWVLQTMFMAFVWFADNAMPTNGSVVGVRNLLEDGSSLNIYCPHIDGKERIIEYGESYKSYYHGGVPAPEETPLLCFLRWSGATHALDMCQPNNISCENVIWDIRKEEVCRKRGTMYFCRQWGD